MIAEAGAEAAADGRRPSTYRIVLPDGWWRIDLAGGQAQSIERLVEQVFRGLDDAPLLKQDLRARLTAQATAAREIGGIELYLSMMVAEPATIPASLLVGLTPPAPEQVMPVEALVEPFAAEPGAVEVSLVDLPSGPAVRRRSRTERSLDLDTGPDLVQYEALVLNVETYQASIAGRPLDLTYMEYELLKFLASNPGRVHTRESLLSQVWGYDYFGGARTVDVHVRRLRSKLGEEHAGLIHTVRSVGYKFGESRWSA